MKFDEKYNFINILKVGYKCRKKIIKVKNIKKNLILLNFFYKKGFICNWKLQNNYININLRYINNKPLIKQLKIISKPGFKVYKSQLKTIRYYKDNIDIILFTSKGLMTLKEAKFLNLGGEIFFIIYY